MTLNTTQSLLGPMDASLIRLLEESFTITRAALTAAKKSKALTSEDRKKISKNLSAIAGATGTLAGELEVEVKNLQKKIENFQALQKKAKQLASDATVQTSAEPLLSNVDVLYQQLDRLLK